MTKTGSRLRNCLPFLWLAAAPLFAALLGSAFNIWYNVIRVDPLLTENQHQWFLNAVLWYNGLAYPPLLGLWLWLVFSLARPYCTLREGEFDSIEPSEMTKLRRRVLNLPWFGVTILGCGWLACAPALSFGLRFSEDPVSHALDLQIAISIFIAALITITHAFYIVELISQELLYPIFFRNARPYETEGAAILSLRWHGILWAISAGFCPIVSLLLLEFGGHGVQSFAFKAAVGGLGIAFGLGSARLLSKLVVDPVHELRDAARAVAAGNLDVRVEAIRADEFGPLIDEFNAMVEGMREKERLRETFGLHVGEEVAQQILDRNPGLGGEERVVSVLFCDIRNYTARSVESGPQKIVRLLNLFFTEMVDIVEMERDLPSGRRSPGGIVLQFLGDGFMAVFGVGENSDTSAEAAVTVGMEMLDHLQAFNRKIADLDHEPVRIGIGVHTGPAVVGSIGSEKRMQFSVIGDTTNLASRVEGLTKEVLEPLLFTRGTLDRLGVPYPVRALEPQWVKGQPQPIEIFTVDRGQRASDQATTS